MNPGIPDHHQLLQSRHPGPDQGVESTVQLCGCRRVLRPAQGGGQAQRVYADTPPGAAQSLFGGGPQRPCGVLKIFQFRLRDFFCRLCQVLRLLFRLSRFLGFLQRFFCLFGRYQPDPEGTNRQIRRGLLPAEDHIQSQPQPPQKNRKCQQHRQRDPKSQQRPSPP